MAHEVEASAHDLRLAAQAVRILHPIVVDQMRAANLAAAKQATILCRDVDLSRLAAHFLDARVERRVAAPGGVDRQRTRHDGGSENILDLEQRLERQRRRYLR